MDTNFLNLVKALSYEKEENFQIRQDCFQAGVFVPVIKVKDELHLLFEKRAPEIRQGGEVSFPGGGVEKEDVSFLDTALRETREELFLSKEDLDVFGALKPHTIPNGTIVYPYVGEIKKDYHALQASKDEVDYLFTVPLHYFLTTKPEVFQKEFENKKRTIYMYAYQEEIIWGLTAEIIVTFVNKITNQLILKENL